MVHIWNWFNDLACASGKDNINYIHIASWRDLMDIDITPFECESILRLDRMYWKHVKNG